MTSVAMSRAPEEVTRWLALAYLAEAADAAQRLCDLTDEEALHDFRVALRRLRSCLRAYRPWHHKLSAPCRTIVRDLVQTTSVARDTEVAITWLRDEVEELSLSERIGASWFIGHLERRKHKAYARIRRRHLPQFRYLQHALTKELSCARLRIYLQRPILSFEEVMGELVIKGAAKLGRTLEGIQHADDEAAAHSARIQAKRLRYLVEPIQVPVVQDRLKELQDLLGNLHDMHVIRGGIQKQIGKPHKRALVLRPGLIALIARSELKRDSLFEKFQIAWSAAEQELFLAAVKAVGRSLLSHAKEAKTAAASVHPSALTSSSEPQ